MQDNTPRELPFGFDFPPSKNGKSMPSPRSAPEPPPVNSARWIPLSKGLFALVDEADFEWVNRYVWHASEGAHTYYARRSRTINGKSYRYFLHRVLVGAPDGMQVDHINGDGLDCRRSNLRICTVKQNHRNLAVQSSYFGKPKTSRFKGVSWCKFKCKWRAGIYSDGKRKSLGYFDCEEDAARRYDAEAIKVFGEYARLNFP